VNGYRSEYFQLGCGTAQGCPASPLFFLLVAEALSRMIVDDKELKGITINKVEHKLSQFADDTVLFLKLQGIKRVRGHIRTYVRERYGCTRECQ
jgi:hypothetical protein